MNTFKGMSSFGFRVSVLTVLVAFFLVAGASHSFADDTVRKAQQAMVDQGIDPGPIDGIWGPKTKRGVTEFQEKEGLEATGELDSATKQKLLGSMEAAHAPDAAASVSNVAAHHSKPVAPQHNEQGSGEYDMSQWAPDADDSEIAEDPTL